MTAKKIRNDGPPLSWDQIKTKLKSFASGRTPEEAEAIAPQVARKIGWPERNTALALRALALVGTLSQEELRDELEGLRKCLTVPV